MIFEKFSEDEVEEYSDMIRAVCSLSNLFSNSDKPYLDYRLAENIYCRCFNATNLSRSDCSIDARVGNVGVGIKTFLDNTNSQKIAEFNRDREKYKDLEDGEVVRAISALRNERLDFTKRTYGADRTIYHCLVRGTGSVNIIENPMSRIDIDNIAEIKTKKNVISFTDGLCEYSFNQSKSTLYKRFDQTYPLLAIDVEIFDDPFEMIKNMFSVGYQATKKAPERDSIVLPLYSIRHEKRYVPEKSGLNQWNASGRRRSHDEVYIPIPRRIHNMHPEFFPERYIEFKLRLPDNVTVLSAKVCQDSGKALMTNPNSALGDWILRNVLKVPEGVLVTYDLLEQLGINAVVLYKNDFLDYSIDFTYTEIYDEGIDLSVLLAE